MSINDCPIKGYAIIESRWDGERYVPVWIRADPVVHIDGLLITDPSAKIEIEMMYDIKEPCLYAGVYTLHGYLREE